MRAKWTCLPWFLEDEFKAGTIVLRPKGIVEGQCERETAIVLGKLVWLGGDQPVDVEESIELVP